MGKRKGCLPLKTLGSKIDIRFDDHSIGDPGEMICEVTGYVTKIDDREIVLRWWTVYDPETRAPDEADDNHEFCRIVQGAVIEWVFNKPKKWNGVR